MFRNLSYQEYLLPQILDWLHSYLTGYHFKNLEVSAGSIQ